MTVPTLSVVSEATTASGTAPYAGTIPPWYARSTDLRLQAIARAARPDYPAWLGHVKAAACTRPVRLAGTMATVDAATGRILTERHTTDLPDGVIYKPCGNRREAVCPACSERYKRDAYQVVRAGLIGGRGVPDDVALHPAVFPTFTAPSFGEIHTRIVKKHTCAKRTACDCRPEPCHARRDITACPHGVRAACYARHADTDRTLGTPLCLDCYDHHAQVVWNLTAGELWRRTTIAIAAADVAAWEKRERASGYAEASIRTWRATLHLILADAVEGKLRDSNPASRRRGRGKRAGRSRHRGPEKIVTTALGVLLIAERAALLSGRDDEFVAVVLAGFTGIRWGELVGLETRYVRPDSVRVEWQLYELDSGQLHRCPPKDDSHRTIDMPEWLSRLVADHVVRTRPKACRCHDLTYVFSGHRPPNGAARRTGATLSDVARLAGVSPATASAASNHPEVVHHATRARIEKAIADLGYVRGGAGGELAAHWRRNNFATWLFQPAATGWYPSKGQLTVRPVPVIGEPWPGIPVRGRNAAGRADSCWLPIARGLTPHGLRHTHRTLMAELGTRPSWRTSGWGTRTGPSRPATRTSRR